MFLNVCAPLKVNRIVNFDGVWLNVKKKTKKKKEEENEDDEEEEEHNSSWLAYKLEDLNTRLVYITIIVTIITATTMASTILTVQMISYYINIFLVCSKYL